MARHAGQKQGMLGGDDVAHDHRVRFRGKCGRLELRQWLPGWRVDVGCSFLGVSMHRGGLVMA